MIVSVATATHVGLLRKANEDSIVHRTDPTGRRGDLVVLADGMGGAAAGATASRLTVETVADQYFASTDPPGAAIVASIAA